MKTAHLTDLQDRPTTARVIWCILATHIIWEGVVKAGFKSDPIFTACMSSFLMRTRVDKSLVTKLESKVTDGLKEIAAATKKVSTLESEVKSLKPTVQTHTKEITALKAKK